MKAIAYDTETTGLNAFKGAKMFSYSTCDMEGNTNVIRLDGKADHRIREAKHHLRKFWEDNTEKVFHNAKFDLRFTEKMLG